MPTSPTQRTLKYLRDEGLHPWIVERWIAPARKRVDLYGLFDLVALDGTGWWTHSGMGDPLGTRRAGIIGVQVTSGSNHAAHRRKMLANPTLKFWHLCGGRALLMSWAKRGRGTKVWTPRIESL